MVIYIVLSIHSPLALAVLSPTIFPFVFHPRSVTLLLSFHHL